MLILLSFITFVFVIINRYAMTLTFEGLYAIMDLPDEYGKERR